MHRNPHQLIEGVLIAAYAAGITHAFIYIRGEYEEEADILDAAVTEAYTRGYVGESILGTGLRLPARRAPRRRRVHLRRGDGAARLARGQARQPAAEAAVPRQPGPLPGADADQQRRDALQRPAHHRATAPTGSASSGPSARPARRSCRCPGACSAPATTRSSSGIPSRDIIYGLAGGPPEGRRVKAWFPGGSSAPVLTEEDLDLPYDFEHMAEAGSMLGSGAIIVVDDSVPIVSVALRLAEFYRHESCGKCVPCREGTNWTVKMLERVDRGEATPMDLDVMADVQGNIIGNCLCVLGDSMAMPVGSMIAQVPGGVRGAYRRGRPSAVRSARFGGTSSADRSHRPTRPRDAQGDWITFTIDGREVRAPEGEWLLDAAKRGDVEVPYFCYEPKLGRARSARAACAWSRSRGCRSCRPPARRRSRTAWSSTRRPTASRTRRTRWSSSCSSTIRSTARCATRAASARCRTSRTAGGPGAAASSRTSATSPSRSRSRR